MWRNNNGLHWPLLWICSTCICPIEHCKYKQSSMGSSAQQHMWYWTKNCYLTVPVSWSIQAVVIRCHSQWLIKDVKLSPYICISKQVFLSSSQLWWFGAPLCQATGLLALTPGLGWTWSVSLSSEKLLWIGILVITNCWRRKETGCSILSEISAQKTGTPSCLSTSQWSEHATWSYPSSNGRKICGVPPSLEMWQSQLPHNVCPAQEGSRNCINWSILRCWGTEYTTCLSLHDFVNYMWWHL